MKKKRKRKNKEKKSDVKFLTLFCAPWLWGYQKHGITMALKFPEYSAAG